MDNKKSYCVKTSLCRKGLPFLFEFNSNLLLKNSDEANKQIHDRLIQPVIKSLENTGSMSLSKTCFRFCVRYL